MQVPNVSNLFRLRLNAVMSQVPVSRPSFQGSFGTQYGDALSAGQAEEPAVTDPADLWALTVLPGEDAEAAQGLTPAVEQNPIPAQLAPVAPLLSALTAPAAAQQPQAGEVEETDDSGLGADVVAFAKQYLGTPYVWGGEDLEKGVDCSGFTQSVYKQFGISLPRTAYRQSMVGQEVPVDDMSNLKPGDLLFFKYDDRAPVTHVTMYIGDGKVIEAAGRREGVTISKLGKNWKSHFVVARRILPQQ